MDQGQMQAIKRLMDERRLAAVTEGTVRPLGITLIAGFQFLKAAVLVTTATLLREDPELVNTPHSPLAPLLYVATRGRYDSIHTALAGGNALPGLMLFLGLYLAATGLGMLSVHAWARRTLLLNCGLTLALWAKATLWPDSAAASPDMTSFYVLLAVDAAVFLYLLQGDMAELFQPRRDGRHA